MNLSDATSLIRYAMMVYPSLRLTEQQIACTANVWCSEFADEPREIVQQAFKLARQESPDWLPSIPRVQLAVSTIKSVLKKKTSEQEFRDSHCGKSENEWRACLDWQESDDGRSKIEQFKQRLKQIVNGNHETSKE